MNGETPLASLSSIATFALAFLKHPLQLGSVVPSSRYLAERVLAEVEWSSTATVVEYGPGIGNITRLILNRLPENGTLIAIEANVELARHLKKNICDERLKVVHGSADRVRSILCELGVGRADVIVSGIPYSTLPEARRESILRASRDALCPTGTLVVYQFTSAVKPTLERLFGDVREEVELRNVLPARIFRCHSENGRSTLRGNERHSPSRHDPA